MLNSQVYAQKKDPPSLQAILLPLVEELLQLEGEGIGMRDYSQPNHSASFNFIMKAILLLWVGDYPGQAKMCNMKHAGTFACHWCTHPFVKELGQVGSCYANNNRRHLPPEHPWRQRREYGADNVDFPEDDEPPATRSHEEVCRVGRRITFDGETLQKHVHLGVDGFCVLSVLKLWNTIWDIPPDFMHVNKDIFQYHLLPLFKCKSAAIPSKPKKRKMDDKDGKPLPPQQQKEIEELYNEQIDLWNQVLLKASAWGMSLGTQKMVDSRCQALSGVSGWITHSTRPVTLSSAVKAAGWLSFSRSGLWPYLLHDIFDAEQTEAIESLSATLAALMEFNCDADVSDEKDMADAVSKLKLQCIETLVILEKELPETKLVAMFHVLLHFPDSVFRWNNMRNFWAFFSERSVSFSFSIHSCVPLF